MTSSFGILELSLLDTRRGVPNPDDGLVPVVTICRPSGVKRTEKACFPLDRLCTTSACRRARPRDGSSHRRPLVAIVLPVRRKNDGIDFNLSRRHAENALPALDVKDRQHAVGPPRRQVESVGGVFGVVNWFVRDAKAPSRAGQTAPQPIPFEAAQIALVVLGNMTDQEVGGQAHVFGRQGPRGTLDVLRVDSAVANPAAPDRPARRILSTPGARRRP